MIGVILDGVYHFKIHIPKETEDKTEKMEKEIEERKKTLELLDEAIEQKKEEKYAIVEEWMTSNIPVYQIAAKYGVSKAVISKQLFSKH